MRLIDADDFFARMENDTDLCAEMEEDGLKSLKKYLDMQPSAYSVDEVVEEMKKLQTYNMSLVTIMDDLQKNGVYRHYICLEDAIEIVKQGCVDDDVCEWKYNDSEYYFESSCEHLHIFMSDGPKENEYRFCPYCGKKIKAVK